MRKLALLLSLCFIALCMNAQDTTIDYVYSDGGFMMKTVEHPRFDSYGRPSNYAYESMGLYSSDGKILVSASTCVNGSASSPGTYAVAYGTEVIAPRAFQYLQNCYIIIPSTVKYIAPDALISATAAGGYTNRIVAIYDDTDDLGGVTTQAPSIEPNAAEVARYNLQGIRLDDPQSGINIVQHADGSSTKELRD